VLQLGFPGTAAIHSCCESAPRPQRLGLLAEAAFATSIAVARRQGAKLLEDCATASLDRLWTTWRAQSAR
jgi:hypothetical protein